MSTKTESDTQPRIPVSRIKEYLARINELMERRHIPPSYSRFNRKTGRGIFVYNTEDCRDWVQVYIEIKGDKGSMTLDMRRGTGLDIEVEKTVPIKEGIIQNAFSGEAA